MTEHGSPESGARVAEELRALLDTAAERAQPWLNQLREAGTSGKAGEATHSTSSCGWCPLCAAISLARGERPELAERLATHTLGLLGTLRAAMEPDPDAAATRANSGGQPADDGGAAESSNASAADHNGATSSTRGPAVQKITVARTETS